MENNLAEVYSKAKPYFREVLDPKSFSRLEVKMSLIEKELNGEDYKYVEGLLFGLSNFFAEIKVPIETTEEIDAYLSELDWINRVVRKGLGRKIKQVPSMKASFNWKAQSTKVKTRTLKDGKVIGSGYMIDDLTKPYP